MILRKKVIYGKRTPFVKFRVVKVCPGIRRDTCVVNKLNDRQKENLILSSFFLKMYETRKKRYYIKQSGMVSVININYYYHY